MYYTSSVQAFSSSLSSVWQNVASAVPTFLVALVVFSFGLLAAGGLGNLARRLVRATKLNVVIEKAASIIKLQTLGYKLDVARLIGLIVHWFFAIVTLLAVADILHQAELTAFLRRVMLYIPNVLVAILILGFGLVLARFIGQVVERGVKSSHLPAASAGALSMIAEWSVILFAIMASMTQLGLAARLVEILFTGLVSGLAIAFGLAFGLGGKDRARDWLDQVTRGLNK